MVFTDASIAALQAGGVTTVSVISPGYDAERALGILAEHPQWHVGVHLSLTGAWAPLTPADQVPSLINERGVMWDTTEEVAMHVLPEEARIEWDAQIRKVLDSGVNMTHLDSHMGCYFASPELFMVALDLARTYRVPLIAPYDAARMDGLDPHLLPVASYVGIYQIPEAEETLENRAAAYHELLAGLGRGVHYIFSHHALPDAEHEDLGDLPIRRDDFAYWTGDLSRAALTELGISRINTDSIRDSFLSALE